MHAVLCIKVLQIQQLHENFLEGFEIDIAHRPVFDRCVCCMGLVGTATTLERVGSLLEQRNGAGVRTIAGRAVTGGNGYRDPQRKSAL